MPATVEVPLSLAGRKWLSNVGEQECAGVTSTLWKVPCLSFTNPRGLVGSINWAIHSSSNPLLSRASVVYSNADIK